jgi:PE family
MSYLVAATEHLASAATDLANIGSTVSAATAAAAGPTSLLQAAAADEVSAAVTSVFAGHAQAYHALSAQAALFHQKFVQALNSAANAYAGTEAGNASPLQYVQQGVQGVEQAGSAARLATTQLADTLLTDLRLPTGLANVPVNLFDDIANIPYNEFMAIQESAHALGPAPVLNATTGQPINPTANPIMYAPIGPGGAEVPVGIAGTGSWWMESVGNTWFWNNGNFAQLDAIAHILLPFPAFTDPAAAQLQLLAMAELPTNDAFDQYEFTNVPALAHGFFKVPPSQLLSGYTFPASGPTVTADGVPVVWAGQTVKFVPGLAVESFAHSLTATPTGIEHIPGNEVIPTLTMRLADVNDFNPFVTGSFVYWGGPTLYNVPALLGGLVTGNVGLLTGTDIPNPLLLGGAATGAEPSWGPEAGPSYFLPGLIEGFSNLVKAFQGIPGDSGPPV